MIIFFTGDPKKIANRMDADSNFAEHAALIDEDEVSLSNMGGEVKLIIYGGPDGSSGRRSNSLFIPALNTEVNNVVRKQ